MQAEREFELKLVGGKTVKWLGRNGRDAAQRYADCHETEIVLAWRYPRTEFRPHMIKIAD